MTTDRRTAIDGSTARHYAADFRRFDGWCRRNGRTGMPADLETLTAFVADELASGLANATIGRRLAAIGHISARAGFVVPVRDPRVRNMLRAIRQPAASQATSGFAASARRHC